MRDNGIGGGRIWHVVECCLARRMRFAPALDHLRSNPQDFNGSGLRGLLAEVDRILEVAGQLMQHAGEDFGTWLSRVCDVVEVPPADRQLVLQVAEAVLGELEDLDHDEGHVGPSFSNMMVSAITRLGDALPPAVPGQVTLTTMHGAKGLSADVVIVLQVEDEVIPGDDDVDEARRLLYVSLTRAKKHLVVTACEGRTGSQRFVGQRVVAGRSLSRFVAPYGLVADTVDGYLRST